MNFTEINDATGFANGEPFQSEAGPGDGHWFIDGHIDLTGVCENEDWHLASVERALVELGISKRDAEAFTDFAFHVSAAVTDDPAELSVEQFQRLSISE